MQKFLILITIILRIEKSGRYQPFRCLHQFNKFVICSYFCGCMLAQYLYFLNTLIIFWCQCATWMTIIVPTSMAAYLYLYSHGEVSLAASQPVYYLSLISQYLCGNHILVLLFILIHVLVVHSIDSFFSGLSITGH